MLNTAGLRLAALGLLLAATRFPGQGLGRPAGLALALAAGYLGLLLLTCYLRYRAMARRF